MIKMTLRIVLSACVRGLRHSFLVDPHILMTRKKRFVTLPASHRGVSGRFCSTGTVSAENPETETESPKETEGESPVDCQVTVPVQEAENETVKFLIVGLGNPERLGTRHSVGMNFVDKLAIRLRTNWTREKFKHTGGHTASVSLNNKVEIHLLKPRVPMNINGTSVIKSVNFFSINPENVYLIHDELGKPVGKFQIKDGGSASGHNGVKSVLNSLKCDVMPRVRIGIDRPASQDEVIDYVLEPFKDDEFKLIRTVMIEAMQNLFKHMGEKSGRDLNLDTITRERQSVDYSDPKEAGFKFGQRSGYKNKRQDFARNDRDFRGWDSRDRFKDRWQGRQNFDFDERRGRPNSKFEQRNGLQDFDFGDENDLLEEDYFRGRRNFGTKNREFRNSFHGDKEEFDYDEDFKPRRRNSLFRNDE